MGGVGVKWAAYFACFAFATAADAAGVAGIWKAEPKIKCEIIDLYTCGPDLTVVANINVVVNAEVTIKVCDVIEFDASGRGTSLNAFLKKD